MKKQILSLLFVLISSICFANSPVSVADSISTFIKEKFVEVGANNLNQLIRSNNENDLKGESSKNRYVFNFNQVLTLSLPDGRYVKDFTPNDYKSRLSSTFEDDLNERLVEINNQLDTGKPKIYVGFDGFLGQAITSTILQEIKGGTVTFSDFENEIKKNVKYIKKWDQVETAYKNIFTLMEGSIDLSKNPEGVEIIRMGVFDEIKVQNYENELKPIATTWVSRNFEYFKGTGVNDPLRIRLYDTDIRPSIFTDLGYPSSIKSATNSENYNSKSIIDFLDKFATNIKEALKGNLKAINCVDFPDQSTITSIQNPEILLLFLRKFDDKCFKKLTVNERIHILDVVSKSALLTDKTGFWAFFKRDYGGFGGENAVLAVIKNVPDALHARDFLRELIAQKIVVSIIQHVDGVNFQDLIFSLTELTTKFLPFDGNYERLLNEKKVFHWNADLPINDNPAFAIWARTKNLTTDGNFHAYIYEDGNHLRSHIDYFTINPFEYVAILSNSPLPGVQMGSGNGLYGAAIPAIYLYWLETSRSTANAATAAIIVVNVIVFRQGMVAATTAPRFWAVLGALDAASSVASLTLMNSTIRNALATKFGVSGTQFAENVETIQFYYAIGSGGVLLTTFGVKYLATSKFWKVNRAQIVSQNVMSQAEVQQMDDLLAKGATRVSYGNIDNWIDSITDQAIKSQIQSEIATWSDDLLTKLDNIAYRNPRFYNDVVKRIQDNGLNPLVEFKNGYSIIKSYGAGFKEVELDMYALDRTRKPAESIFQANPNFYVKNPASATFELSPTPSSADMFQINPSGTLKVKNQFNPSSTQYVMLNGGEYMYVVDEFDNIIIGTRNNYPSNWSTFTGNMPHPTLVGGVNPNIKCAGTIEFRGGKVFKIDYNSGHFKPYEMHYNQVKNIFISKFPLNSFHELFDSFKLIN